MLACDSAPPCFIWESVTAPSMRKTVSCVSSGWREAAGFTNCGAVMCER